jgi:SAM-dependent methyltransferase
MQELHLHVHEHFDLVLCMGNSLPHLLNDQDLEAALDGFRTCLRPGGHVVIHLLNYERILDRRERIVAATRHGEHEYIRFYDFLGDILQFNILRIDWAGDTARGGACELSSTPLRPYRRERLTSALKAAEFDVAECLGDYEFGAFDAQESGSMILLARACS